MCKSSRHCGQIEAAQLEKADLVEWLLEEVEHGMRLQLQLERWGV